jgi:hypothetical protein
MMDLSRRSADQPQANQGPIAAFKGAMMTSATESLFPVEWETNDTLVSLVSH